MSLTCRLCGRRRKPFEGNLAERSIMDRGGLLAVRVGVSPGVCASCIDAILKDTVDRVILKYYD